MEQRANAAYGAKNGEARKEPHPEALHSPLERIFGPQMRLWHGSKCVPHGWNWLNKRLRRNDHRLVHGWLRELSSKRVAAAALDSLQMVRLATCRALLLHDSFTLAQF